MADVQDPGMLTERRPALVKVATGLMIVQILGNLFVVAGASDEASYRTEYGLEVPIGLALAPVVAALVALIYLFAAVGIFKGIELALTTARVVTVLTGLLLFVLFFVGPNVALVVALLFQVLVFVVLAKYSVSSWCWRKTGGPR